MAKRSKQPATRVLPVRKATSEQARAKKALNLASVVAADLRQFHTVAGILADGIGLVELDDFLFPVEGIARKCFEGGAVDMERAFMKAIGVDAFDDRVSDLLFAHQQECVATALAAFALGATWEREGGAR